MSSASIPTVVNTFKKVYGSLVDLLPEDYLFAADIPFNEGQKVGESYTEAVVLTNETGWTLLGSSMNPAELNPAIAGAVQQVTVVPYETVLASLIPWGVISRSAGGGDKAFFQATKHVVKNNIRSHGKLLEILRIYGRSAQALGYVSYYTGTYRGVSFNNGTGTLNGIAFTNGINVASKAILLGKGWFASGIWVGTEGAALQEIDASNVVINEGKLVTVEALYGYITVDFVPTAASSLTSHRLCFKGMATSQDAPGIVNILSATGLLFGLSTAQYSLWKGTQYDVNQAKLTLDVIQLAIAQAVNRGSLDGDIDLYVNPRTWARFSQNEAALRMYDSSYKSSGAENGFKSITYFSQAGKITVKSHRFIMEGQALGMHLEDWSRSGSAEISFKVPGMTQELIFPVENMNCYAFRSYADQYIFCHAPAKSILFININDEAA